VEIHRLKEWLRQNPDRVPAGLDATTSTSHQLRGALMRMGWSAQETPGEFRLFPPGAVPVDDLIGAADEETQVENATDAYFTLEYQLRDFLAGNLASVQIDGRKLRLFVDETGRDGVEYPTATGPIDILAVDSTGAFFVFELKRANSPDSAVGQLARYMGWVKQTIGRNKDVFGVIVAKGISPKLRYARTVVPGIFLFEYEVSFQLNEAHDIAKP
jgi:hypothetical protein